jgi:hypothetical protein
MVLRNGGHATQNVHQEKREKWKWEEHPTQNNIINKIIILGNGGQVTQNVHKKKIENEKNILQKVTSLTSSKHLFKFFKY